MTIKNVLVLSFNIKLINNIISIGDAEYEYYALLNLYENDPDNYRLLKSVKFLKYPNNNQILEQINIVNNAIENICTHSGHLDLRISNR